MNGTACPNKVKRSLSLRLVCSDQTEILSVDEVSICQYEGVLAMPWVCQIGGLRAY